MPQARRHQDHPSKPSSGRVGTASGPLGTPTCKPGASRAPPPFRYRIVVWISAWPIHSCTRRMSALAIIRVPKV
jgi:hypothetical protein